MERWNGRVALVTGASAGIGAAICKALVKAGLRVVGAARGVEKIEKLSNSLKNTKGSLDAVKCDLTKEDDIRDLFKTIKEKHGGVDICINNAGLAFNKTLMEGTVEEWRNLTDVNLIAPCLCSQHTILSLRERGLDDGQIINISSTAGHIVPPHPSGRFYAGTKFALMAVTEGLRQEMREAKSHIRISIVSPGVVETEFAPRMFKDNPEMGTDFYSFMECLQGEDIANSVLYILSAPPHVEMMSLSTVRSSVASLRLVLFFVVLTMISFSFLEFEILGRNYQRCEENPRQEEVEERSPFEDFLEKYDEEMRYRRDIAQKICLTFPEFLNSKIESDSLHYEEKTHLALCLHSKAGSAAWAQIQNQLSSEIYASENIEKNPLNGKKISNFLNENFLKKDSTILVNVVQHPFTRIMEGYLERMKDDTTSGLKASIIEKFRRPPLTYENWKQVMSKRGIDDEKNVTPQEYILNIASDFEKCTLASDRMHCISLLSDYYRPYHTECSPCAFNYTVISKIETFENDLIYIRNEMEKMLRRENSTSVVKKRLKVVLESLNTAKKFYNKRALDSTMEFTKEVFALLSEYEKQLIWRVYRFDFLLFDYDPFEFS